MRRKKVEPFNPFAPQRENPHQFQHFSDEWVKHNKWMGDENTLMDRQKAYKLAVSMCRTKIRMPTFEDYVKNPSVMEEFINTSSSPYTIVGENLPAGVYFLQAFNEEGSIQTKLIKQ